MHGHGVADRGAGLHRRVFHTRSNNILCAAHGSKFGVQASLPLILGMGVGWSLLGILMATTSTIEQHQTFFLPWGGWRAARIASIGVSVMRNALKTEDVDERLGFTTGFMLQVVNGKAWIHFLVLMTTFGQVFGSGALAKVLLVLLNLSFGWPAVLTWAAFGSTFAPCSHRAIRSSTNQIFGSLVGVAVLVLA